LRRRYRGGREKCRKVEGDEIVRSGHAEHTAFFGIEAHPAAAGIELVHDDKRGSQRAMPAQGKFQRWREPAQFVVRRTGDKKRGRRAVVLGRDRLHGGIGQQFRERAYTRRIAGEHAAVKASIWNSFSFMSK